MKGICSICLEHGPLSFEHVPPKRVFNHKPAVAHTIYGLSVGSKFKKPPQLLQGPRGLGRRALCESCNGKTGAWYGDAFADWTMQCLAYAEKLRNDTNVLLPFHIMPLNVIKQILVMALAVSGSKSGGNKIDHLRRFVLSKQSMTLSPEFVIKTYFNPSDPARTTNPVLTQNRLTESCAVLDTRTGTSVFVVAEVAFPPMGYVVYTALPGVNITGDFASLCDLRCFTQFYYDQKYVPFLHVPVRCPFGPVPGYYPNLNKRETKFLD